MKSQRDIQGRTSDHEGRDAVNAVISQGTPRIAGNYQKVVRSKDGSSLRAFRQSMVQLIP